MGAGPGLWLRQAVMTWGSGEPRMVPWGLQERVKHRQAWSPAAQTKPLQLGAERCSRETVLRC